MYDLRKTGKASLAFSFWVDSLLKAAGTCEISNRRRLQTGKPRSFATYNFTLTGALIPVYRILLAFQLGKCG